MTEGISKESLENKRKQLQLADLTSKNAFELALVIELISECTELEPSWLEIDENTPKDREVLLFYPEQRIFDTLMGKQIYAGRYKTEHKDYCRQPTHYKLLPEDPK